MDLRPAHSRDDRGETLIELIVALAILGVAGVAILTGLMFSTRASTLQRNEATGGAYVRSFAEAVQNHVDLNGLASCGSAAGTYASVAVPDLPGGYSRSVTAVRTWNGSAWVACAAGVQQVQQVEFQVTSPGDAVHQASERMTVVLRKPCNGDAATVGDNPCAP